MEPNKNKSTRDSANLTRRRLLALKSCLHKTQQAKINLTLEQ